MEGRSFTGSTDITEIIIGMNGFSVESPSHTFGSGDEVKDFTAGQDIAQGS